MEDLALITSETLLTYALYSPLKPHTHMMRERRVQLLIDSHILGPYIGGLHSDPSGPEWRDAHWVNETFAAQVQPAS